MPAEGKMSKARRDGIGRVGVARNKNAGRIEGGRLRIFRDFRREKTG